MKSWNSQPNLTTTNPLSSVHASSTGGTALIWPWEDAVHRGCTVFDHRPELLPVDGLGNHGQGGPTGPLAPPPRRPGLRSRCRSRYGRANAGRLARRAEDFGTAINRESPRAAADLTREPSRWPSSGYCGQAEASPIRQQAYGPSPLVKSAAPSARQLYHAIRAGRTPDGGASRRHPDRLDGPRPRVAEIAPVGSGNTSGQGLHCARDGIT